MKRAKKAAIAAVSMALLVAACGDDSKSATPTTTAATPTTAAGAPATTVASGPTTALAPAASKATFKVMVAGDFTSPGFPVPETLPAVKAALKDVPGATVEGCDSKGDQNAALACGRKAVSDGVSVVITGFSGLAQDFSVLTTAGIPIIGDLGSDTQANAFALSGGAASYAALGLAAATAGCKRGGILYLDGNPDSYLNMVTSGLKQGGAVEAARASVAANAPDMSAPIAKLLDAKADCILPIILPTQVIQALTAIKQSGAKVQVAGFGAIFPADVIKSLGPLGEGVIVTESQLGADSKAPVIDQVAADMKPFDSSAKITTLGLLSWASGRIVAAAVKDATGPVDAATMLADMNAVRDVDTGGVLHSYSSIPLTNPAFARLFNHYGLNYRITNGVPVADGDFYDLGPALES